MAPRPAFDRFYGYDELTEILQGWADERSELHALESIGKSHEGRDIWLATITNTETGPALEKPALLIEANIHAVEVTGAIVNDGTWTHQASSAGTITSVRGNGVLGLSGTAALTITAGGGTVESPAPRPSGPGTGRDST